jgi:NTP pyrophosphatase (non-canonical NTP hydrolase)
LEVGEFQRWMEERYGDRDRKRGLDRTFGWFVEEVGELSSAFRKGTRADIEHEFGDAFAWLASLANLQGIDLEQALARYRDGCPRCSKIPCDCPFIA